VPLLVTVYPPDPELELEPELAPVLLLEDEHDLDMFVVSSKGLKGILGQGSVLDSVQKTEE
jgi:hypothetical protein